MEITEGTPKLGGMLDQIAKACDGDMTVHTLTNDRGEPVHSFATMSIPLRKDHWIYQRDQTPAGFTSNVPPMPFRMGDKQAFSFGICNVPAPDKEGTVSFENPIVGTLNKRQIEKAIRAAGKYAVRCATMNGSEMDFDPDALLQNLVVGFLGYWTETGLTGDPEDAAWCDPQKPFDFTEDPPRNFPLNTQDGPTGANPQSA